MRGRVFRKKNKNGGTWAIRYDLPVGPNEARKQRQETLPGLNKKQAEQKLRDIITAIQNGTFVAPSNTTVGEYLERWLADYAKSAVAAKTYERYNELIRKHIMPALGNKYLDKLRPTDIQSYYSQALGSGRLDGKGGLSAQTVVHIHRILHKALGQAVKWQLLARNPADAVDPPKVQRKEIKVITPAQIHQLLKTAEGSLYHIPIMLAITTGMRRGEILALRWDDIDLDTGRLTLRRSLTQTKAGLAFKDPKTSGSRRTIQLPKLAIRALTVHKGRQAEWKLGLGEAYSDQGLVCTFEDGSPIPPNYLSNNFRWLLPKAGLPHIRFHELRHTSATMLVAEGVPVKVVSERLGHSTTAITQDIYAHVLPNMQQRAADMVDALLDSSIGDSAGS